MDFFSGGKSRYLILPSTSEHAQIFPGSTLPAILTYTISERRECSHTQPRAGGWGVDRRAHDCDRSQNTRPQNIIGGVRRAKNGPNVTFWRRQGVVMDSHWAASTSHNLALASAHHDVVTAVAWDPNAPSQPDVSSLALLAEDDAAAAERAAACACIPATTGDADEWWINALCDHVGVPRPQITKPWRRMPQDMFEEPEGLRAGDSRAGTRRLVFTLHNFARDADGFPWVFTNACYDDQVKYFVAGIEVCPTTGREHIQGYMELSRNNTYNQVRARPWAGGEAVWLAAAKADWESNFLYCSKEGDYVCFGKPQPGQGHRSDWAKLFEAVRDGRSNLELAEAHPNLVLPNVGRLDAWRQLALPPPVKNGPTKPILLYGLPGAGKSYWVSKNAPDAWVLGSRRDDEKVWNGYVNQEHVLIEEGNGLFKFNTVKAMFDNTLFHGQVLGGSPVAVVATHIFMTTNLHPAYWFQDYPWDATNAWRRRIKDYGELWVFRAPTEHPPSSDHPQGYTEYHPPVRDIALLPPVPLTQDDHVAIERHQRRTGGRGGGGGGFATAYGFQMGGA